MRKVKYVALILVLALGLIGGAYAAWTDSLAVEGTVATGELNVEVIKARLTLPYTDIPGLLGSNISSEGKKVTVSMTNLYPGHPEYKMDFDLENKSSIPVRFNAATLNFEHQDSPLIDHLKVRLEVSHFPGGGSTGQVVIPLTDWFPLVDLPDKLASLKNLVLQVDDVLTFGGINREGEPECIRIRLNENAGNDTQNNSVTFTLDLVFKQWNI